MREIEFEDIIQILNELGIQKGDGLLVHSSIQFLGRPIGGVGLYFKALSEAIGLGSPTDSSTSTKETTGTLVVPTFNFAFARGEPYDPRTTPSQGMGALSEYVRQLPETRRTRHPMQSLAVIGRWADDLVSRDTASAFDFGSAFERMLDLDFRLLLLGADVQAVSMVHYSEQRADVPYRYWKEFSGEVFSDQGWQTQTYRMFVRDLKINAQLDLQPIQEELEKRSLWHSLPLNYGRISTCRLIDFVSIIDQLLTRDPWCLVKEKFTQGIS